MKQIYACELKIGDVLINVGKINKITHEQARMIIEYENANQGVFTEKQLNDLRGYFTQQEKKDELLGLYQKQFPIKRSEASGYLNRMTFKYELSAQFTFFDMNTSDIFEKIKVLETQLKESERE